MKRILSMLLIVGLVFVFSACSSNDGDYNTGDVDETEIGAEEDIDPEDGDIGRGLAMLKEDPAEGNDYGFFLLRDGEDYTLGTSCHNEYAPTGSRTLYESAIIDVGNQKGFNSIGYVPVPVLQPDDIVVCYSRDSVPILELSKVSFYGYTTGAIYHEEDKVLTYYIDIVNDEDVTKKGVSDFKVTDLNGNVASDYYNLNESEGYTISWYEGTQYEEEYLVADSKMYVFDSSEFDHDYEVEGTLTKNGYAEYDLSNIPAGTYRISTGPNGTRQGLITIE